MKLRDALIAYNPGTAEIRVGRLLQEGDRDWTRPYRYTTGACEMNVRAFKGIVARHYILSTFVGMVVRDMVDAGAAHKALMVIDEYRAAIPADMGGEA